MSKDLPIVVIGAGPAGLAAAYELANEHRGVLVLEKDVVVGGLARTVEYKGFRCDIGGHRFFTKADYVNKLWHEVLGEQFLRRPRMSRIFYQGKFYSYPLSVGNALGNLGLVRSIGVMGSFAHSRMFPRHPEKSLTDWVSNRFGKRLFDMFFRSYTEKVWGISCDRLSADWAAQRIKNLSLGKAIWHAMGFGGKKSVASLIEEFEYPALGPGQMYETMAKRAQGGGAEIRMSTAARQFEHDAGRITAVLSDNSQVSVGEGCFSSMPLDELIAGLRPAPPPEVLQAAKDLSYRSIVTVNLLLDQAQTVPDTWIYIHDPDVIAGRIQFYKNWSPHMVPDPSKSVLGLEYFCTEGDDFWRRSDAQIYEMALRDLAKLKIANPGAVFDSFIVKYAKAYPVYDEGYAPRLATIRQYLGGLRNLYPIGRYGQFRYNNMDHSILTAHYSVQALHGAKVDPWSVNEEQEYHEEKSR